LKKSKLPMGPKEREQRSEKDGNHPTTKDQRIRGGKVNLAWGKGPIPIITEETARGHRKEKTIKCQSNAVVRAR